MARSTSKQKGSAFERQVCKALSLWVSGGKSEDLFWRSAMSGGRATVGRKAGKDHAHHAGDITATSPAGHALTDAWYVECKAYRDLAIKSALFEGKGTLAGFWRETCMQATHYNKMPMMIAKQNNTRVMLITPVASALNPYGPHPIDARSKLATLSILRAEVFCFVSAMTHPFPFRCKQETVDHLFLAPGELDRILSGKRKRASITKKQRVKIIRKAK